MGKQDHELWYMDTIIKRVDSIKVYWDKEQSMYIAEVWTDPDHCGDSYGDYEVLVCPTIYDLNMELIKITNGGIVPDGA